MPLDMTPKISLALLRLWLVFLYIIVAALPWDRFHACGIRRAAQTPVCHLSDADGAKGRRGWCLHSSHYAALLKERVLPLLSELSPYL